jgi:hypothetical protein
MFLQKTSRAGLKNRNIFAQDIKQNFVRVKHHRSKRFDESFSLKKQENPRESEFAANHSAHLRFSLTD